VTPFQYNPVTKELIVYRDVKVEIIFEGGTGEFGTDRLRSRWFDPILQDALINYASLPVIDYNKRLHGNMNGRDDVGYEYLIVIPTNPEYAQWADTIKAFRQKQGIITGIVTLTEIGGNTPTILENYFNNAYNTWDIPPVAVLLMADYGTSTANSITSPIWDNYCASDNIFADVTNNDMPDIIFARMTAQNATHLETMVTKFTNYEMDPPTSQDFYDKPITALGWQTERWFQLCSETVGGFWRSQGRDPVRVNAVYQGSPGSIWSSATNTSTVVNYFGPNGLGYIPATPAELGGWTGGTATMVNNAINSGSFMLQHRDHGYEQGWGEPSYSSSNISSLTNNSDNELVYVFSVNCLTGKYNMGGECFAEKFHRYKYNGENAGCLGILAASEVSYSFVNDVYVWGMYDNMWPEFMPEYGMPVEERGILPAFGNAAGKYFLQQSSWPYNTNNKEVTYNLFHHHGDAFTTVYSEVPMDLTVNNNPVLYSGETTYSVTADVGSFIALTVNGEIIGTAEGTGFPVIIDIEAQLPPNMMLVTVTKQNYYRYETNVEIIPPSGPYVVFEACVLDDFAGGNGNGMMDFSEDILFDVTLKNVGVEVAANVEATLSTGNEYITITNAVADFGNIDPNASLTLNGAFEIEVADNIPDDLTVSFEVSASDGTDSWVSSFTLKSHAPNLEVGSISVSDPSGNNNGNLDPGETADIMFETSNTGSSIAFMVMTNLASSSPFITLNSTSYDLENLEIGESKQATFNVTVSPAAPIGSTADFIYEVVCGGYEVEAMIGIKIGLIIEDFETGDFSGYEWEFAGNANWTISSGAYEGTYCAKSGTIGDQQTSQLLIELEVMNDDSISFFYKVSSEATYDFLQFFIDGAMKDEWSGNAGWLRAAYPVNEGTHTFKWIYDKDYSESNGSDCGWIDYITFPAMVDESLMAYAGPDSEICEDLNFTPSASANNYNSLLWETSGTGTFSDNTILDPVYTPSGDDYSSGSVTLTLTAYGTGEDISDDLLLSFMPMPEQCASPVGTTELCVNAPETTYSTTGAANATDYMWELVPENAGTLDYDGMTATVSWTEDYFGDVQLMVKGMNGCGEGDMSETLDISIIPAPGIAAEPTGDNTICEGTASTIYETTGAEWADGYVWTLTPAEAGTLTENGMSVEVTCATGWMGNAEINVAGVNNCGEGEISNAYPMNLITVPEAPDTPSGLTDLCADTEMTTYTISGVTYAEEYIWTITPEEAGTIAGNGTTADV
nr:hypothetical protein [Bacteroidota bacterium]